jgi:hypothetical protein
VKGLLPLNEVTELVLILRTNHIGNYGLSQLGILGCATKLKKL